MTSLGQTETLVYSAFNFGFTVVGVGSNVFLLALSVKYKQLMRQHGLYFILLLAAFDAMSFAKVYHVGHTIVETVLKSLQNQKLSF